jgi:hypothetical protein
MGTTGIKRYKKLVVILFFQRTQAVRRSTRETYGKHGFTGCKAQVMLAEQKLLSREIFF